MLRIEKMISHMYLTPKEQDNKLRRKAQYDCLSINKLLIRKSITD